MHGFAVIYGIGFMIALAVGGYVAWMAPSRSDALETMVLTIFVLAPFWPFVLFCLLLAKCVA